MVLTILVWLTVVVEAAATAEVAKLETIMTVLLLPEESHRIKLFIAMVTVAVTRAMVIPSMQSMGTTITTTFNFHEFFNDMLYIDVAIILPPTPQPVMQSTISISQISPQWKKTTTLKMMMR